MNKINFIAITILAACTLRAAVKTVAIPQSPVITYGMVRDEYGSPLSSAAAAVLTLVKDAEPDSRTFSRSTVGETPILGMNYRLSLEMDSADGGREYAVVKGTPMRIRCHLDGVEAGLSPSPVFAAPVNGTAQRKDFSIGEDADGDGIPDAWEQWVLAVAGRSADSDAIAAFRPDADADGDGMTNYQEFLAGTDPFLATDLLAITSYVKVDGKSRYEIKFTTVPERTYRLVVTTTLDTPVWVPAATTRAIDGVPAYETYNGTGRIITIYVDVPSDAPAAFFRIAGN